MVVFDKLSRTGRSSRVHRTELGSAIGHAWVLAVCSTGWDQKQQNCLECI